MPTHKTLAIVGAGALIEAWAPVIEGMRANGDEVRTASAANFALARIVYVGRQLESYSNSVPEWDAHKLEFRANLKRLKEAVAWSLQRAQATGRLLARAELPTVVRKLVIEESDEAAIVTTNWDSVIEEAVRRIDAGLSTFYLHGSTKAPGSIYLPSEIAEEPYRTDGEKAQLVAIRRDLVRAITSATRLVLYGISVSPLDAELGQLLASGMHGSAIQEVHIVNPHFEDVCERLVTLVDDESPNIKVFGCHPSRLGEAERLLLRTSEPV
jgi:hypothetical protein